MMPFLCNQLEKVLRRLMLMFVIYEDVNKVKFAGDLALVRFNKTKHQLPAALVELPTATSSALCSIDADEALKVQFEAEWKQVLVAILEKFMERSPLSYKMCHAATAISTVITERMVLSKKNSKMKFSAICDTLFDSHYVSSEDRDKAKEQYPEFPGHSCAAKSGNVSGIQH